MIRWNEVTWYSRIASIIIFVGVMPVVNFFIGVQYEQTQAVLIAAENAQIPPAVTLHKPNAGESTTTPATKPTYDSIPVSTP